MDNYLIKLKQAADYIKTRLADVPKIGIVLGSGLGSLVDEIEEVIGIDYSDIPGFPVATVEGHEGKLIAGKLSGAGILAMKGRFHFYEGYDMQSVVFYIRVFKLLGIEKLLVTNAAGGINRSFKPGDLMLISDHIGLFAPSVLRGANLDEFGVRFPDMTDAYSREARRIAKEAAEQVGILVKEGVYAFAQGPMYETPAEIRAFSVMGADAVGMSTVPEVITAVHSGIKVLGISCITNMAAGILDRPLYHGEVTETAKKAENDFKLLISHIVSMW